MTIPQFFLLNPIMKEFSENIKIVKNIAYMLKDGRFFSCIIIS